tara:strand:+ start:254 stop:481 length:228 start_codon:yes stop_codon:yes gene_type:complete
MKILLNFNHQVEATNPWNVKKPVQRAPWRPPVAAAMTPKRHWRRLVRNSGIVADFEKNFPDDRHNLYYARGRTRP